MNINDLNKQIIITDNNGTRYFEIHQNRRILGGYDYTRGLRLSEKECKELVKNSIKVNKSLHVFLKMEDLQIERSKSKREIY